MSYNEDAIFKMDAAFRARMRAAIAAGLECAPTSISTEPGTKNPRYLSDLTARYHRSVNDAGNFLNPPKKSNQNNQDGRDSE
jgi:hypothetical protein